MNAWESDSTDIVVCVHDALADVRLCLESVVACGDDRPYRLIIVDDGSGPECAAFLRAFVARPACELLRHEVCRGYTEAANTGLRRSTAPRVVLLNSDTIVTPGWLAGLRECLESAPEIGIAGPLSNAASYQSVPLTRSRSGDWSLNPLPTAWGVDQIAALVRSVSPRQFPRLPFLNGFCLMIAREVLAAIGDFDATSFPHGFGEENDYCLRARDAGFALAVADHVYVFHAKSSSYRHARRRELSAQGRAALERKRGAEHVRSEIAAIDANAALAPLRDAIGNELRFSSPPPVCPAPDALSVLFLLPVSGGGGGAHSVVQEAMGMRLLGVCSHVAIRAKHAALYAASYPAARGSDLFLPFATEDDLVARVRGFDVVVATIYTSVPLLATIAAAHPDVLPAYYVQDYEPWFFREGSSRRASAEASYTLLPEMLLFAKTTWLRRLVQERHGVPMHAVKPSLDHDVFSPCERDRSAAEPVRIAAMIRPATPRRQPAETMDTLDALAWRFRERAAFHIFGASDEEIAEHGLTPDFPVVNHGRLIREEVAALLRSVDGFLDLSRYQAFGRSGLEAMACGCAVVLPAAGGVAEYAVPGENALLVDTSDGDACERAAAALIRDAALRQRLQRAGIATAERYSVFQAALSEVALFRDALTSRRG